MKHLGGHAKRVKFSARPRYRKTRNGKRKLIGYYGVAYDPLRKPTRKERPLNTKDKREANRILDQVEKLYRKCRYDWWKKEPSRRRGAFRSLAAAAEEYIALLPSLPAYDGQLRAPKTIRQHVSVVKTFVGWFEEQTSVGALVLDVEAEHVRAFMFERTTRGKRRSKGTRIAKSTAGTNLNRLRPFFRWCVQQHLIDSNPADGIKTPRAVYRRMPLTRQQYEDFLHFLDEEEKRKGLQLKEGLRWMKGAIILGVEAGLREGEICALTWADIDLEGEEVTVLATKTGTVDTVPLSDNALAFLRAEYERRKPGPSDPVLLSPHGRFLNPTTVSARFRVLADRAGLPKGLSFHSSRHACLTWLATAGVSPFEIQAISRHRSLQSVMVYVNRSGINGRTAVKEVFKRAA